LLSIKDLQALKAVEKTVSEVLSGNDHSRSLSTNMQNHQSCCSLSLLKWLH